MDIKRFEVLDIARGLGIIMVVIGHSLSPLRSFVYLFHVPIFFFISGFLHKYDMSYKTFLIKRLKGLYIPVLIYGTIFILGHDLLYKIKFYDKSVGTFYTISDIDKQIIKLIFFTINSTEPLLAGLWFLKSLFIVELLSVAINKLSGRMANYIKMIVFLLPVALVWMLIESKIKYTASLNTTVIIPIIALVFFYIGSLYKKYQYKVKLNLLGTLAAFIVLLVASMYIEVDLKAVLLPNPVVYYIISLIGIYFTFSISNLLKNHTIKNRLMYIGKNTMPILALHLFTFKFISAFVIIIKSLPWHSLVVVRGIPYGGLWILYSIAGVVLPLIILHIINSLKRQIDLTLKLQKA